MSKQVMQKAFKALTLARSQLDVLWVSHHANRTDAALASADAAIAELRAEIAQPEVEPVAWVLFRKDEDGLEPVQFYGGKERPKGEFKDRFELRSVHVSPPDTEAMRQELERIGLQNAKLYDDFNKSQLELERVKGELEQKSKFIEAAFVAHPNLDLDIAAQGGGE